MARRGVALLTWTEIKLFARDPFATVFTLVFPIIMLLLLAAVFGDTPAGEMDDGVLVFRGIPGDDYYMVASIGLVTSALGLLNLPIHLAGYREKGVLKRFHASSVPAWALFTSQLVVGLIVGALGSAIMIGLTLAVFGTQLPEQPAGVVVAFIVATVCFTALGFLLGSLMKTARSAQGISLLIFLVSWMLSGSAPPRSVLPDTAHAIGNAIPLTYVIVALQDPWFGFGWNVQYVLIVVAITVAAAIPAIALFRWE